MNEEKDLSYYLDFNYAELNLTSFELANAKRLVLCIKPSTRKVEGLKKKYEKAKEEYENELEFQKSIVETYTAGLDKLIEKGTATKEVEEVVETTETVEEVEEVEETPESEEDASDIFNTPFG